MKLKQWNQLLFVVVVVACIVWGLIDGHRSMAIVPLNQSNIKLPSQISKISLITQANSGEFIQPPLSYSYKALEPYIDESTMKIHYNKHHRGYINKLNKAIAKHPELKSQSIEQLLSHLDNIPEDIQNTVQNNGGGHFNHSLFWSIMSPNGSRQPTGELAQMINTSFGDFNSFKERFTTAGNKHFGSGWVWLVLTRNGQLEITCTSEQDSPILEGKYPILGNDLWEHAYYLQYQNYRNDYLNAWWNIVNWDEVNERFEEAKNIG